MKKVVTPPFFNDHNPMLIFASHKLDFIILAPYN